MESFNLSSNNSVMIPTELMEMVVVQLVKQNQDFSVLEPHVSLYVVME